MTNYKKAKIREQKLSHIKKVYKCCKQAKVFKLT